MSLGRSFHRIMARGRKLLSVDFLLTTGTGYDDFLARETSTSQTNVTREALV